MSKSPLRRIADQLVLATMRPPAAPQVLVNRPLIRALATRGLQADDFAEVGAEPAAITGIRVFSEAG